MFRTVAGTALVLGFAFTAVSTSAAPASRDTLAELRRQEAGLRDRIARIELDRLVDRIDQTLPSDRKAPRPAQVDREVALYAFRTPSILPRPGGAQVR